MKPDGWRVGEVRHKHRLYPQQPVVAERVQRGERLFQGRRPCGVDRL